MTILYSPNSYIQVNHEIHNELLFNSIIDDPVLKTDRTCSIHMEDATTYNGSLKKRESSTSLVDNCTQIKSTLLYMDTKQGIYIWKREEQSISTNFQVWGGLTSANKVAGVDICFGVAPLLQNISGNYIPIDTLHYIENPTNIECKEIIYAISPNKTGKYVLVEEHLYTKDAFANKPAIGADTLLLDGGSDFYYPLWCRNMLDDPIWKKAADYRVKTLTLGPASGIVPNNISDTRDYKIDTTFFSDPTPVGSFVFNTKGKFIESLIFNMHTDAATTHVHNVVDSNVGDLFTLLTAAGFSNPTSFYPSGII